MLNAQGPAAAGIAQLAWVLFIGGGAIFLLVLILAALALFAPRPWLASKSFIVAGGIAFPVAVLSGLLVFIFGSSAFAPLAVEHKLLKIEVVGEQWWWRVRYLDDAGKPDFVTANEIRIPVGRAVELSLASADVIHSFWVPSLAGKVDMLPGRTNRLRLAADRAGVFRGQCAEYCGAPHALMALHVVAEAPESFELWRQAQRRPAVSGHALFDSRCAVCHTVRGTQAKGERGPDLTHVSSRMFIGAGLLPNNAGTLAGWIASSQHLKPGNLMPEFKELTPNTPENMVRWLRAPQEVNPRSAMPDLGLSERDARDIAAYLSTLK